MSVRLSLILTVGLLLAGWARAGDLLIGHVRVRLGMPQAEALAALGREFDARQVSASQGEFLLWTREPETRASYSAGTVSFRGGKLYRASKTWAAGLIKGKGVAEGLFGVLSQVVGASGRTCRVKAETLRAPGGDRGMDVKLVTIELPPDRAIVLKIYEPHLKANGQWEAGPDVDEYLMELSRSE